MQINKVKGTYDVLPDESYRWRFLIDHITKTMNKYGFKEIRTPIIEYSNVFHRKNEKSDMVNKETYDFIDRGNREITLRPEGTAGVIRSYVENKLYANNDLAKLYSIGPNYRYERPQKGRYREFYQLNVEAIGASNPLLDAEIITLAYDIFNSLSLKQVTVNINSLGDKESNDTYLFELKKHLLPHKETLCQDCQRRLAENPLRILDCKIDKDHIALTTAPKPLDYLNNESKAYFNKVLEILDNIKVPYIINKSLVRGLDYYSHTVFEIVANIKSFGSQNALGGGGRYEKIVSELGGPNVSGIGFGFGLERLLFALMEENLIKEEESNLDCYIITSNKDIEPLLSSILYDLRKNNYVALMNYTNKAFKTQIKQALSLNAKYLLFIGDDELKTNTISIKNTKTEEQENIKVNELINYLNLKLGKKI